MTAIEKAAAKVVALAESEIGYREKATNSQLNDKTANAGANNWTKYAAYFDAMRGQYNFYNGRKNGPSGEWCDMFFDWLQCQCWGPETARKMLYQPMDSCGAGCSWSASYYRANNAWYLSPLVGDQIFFGSKGNENHTGIVVEVTADRVITIEGNANNMVMQRSYAKSYANIAGYGRPRYELVAGQFEKEDDMTEKQIQDMIEKAFKAYTPPPPSKAQIVLALGDKWIETYHDLPAWAKPEVMELIELGALKGTKPSDNPEKIVIQMLLSSIRCCIVSLRLAKTLVGEGPREALIAELEKLLEQLRGTD